LKELSGDFDKTKQTLEIGPKFHWEMFQFDFRWFEYIYVSVNCLCFCSVFLSRQKGCTRPAQSSPRPNPHRHSTRSWVSTTCEFFSPSFLTLSCSLLVEPEAHRLQIAYRDISQKLIDSEIDMGNERRENARLQAQVIHNIVFESVGPFEIWYHSIELAAWWKDRIRKTKKRGGA
jgi:hypothetical protein